MAAELGIDSTLRLFFCLKTMCTEVRKMQTGRNADLEKQANELLNAGVKPKGTRDERELERLMLEAGIITLDELKFYDPANDWDTQSSAYTLATSDVDDIEPTIGAEVDDGLTRNRNRDREARLPLLKHTDTETERATPATKAAPTQHSVKAIPLGQLDKGERKECTKCGISKGLECFYAHPRTKDKRQSQCKACQKS